MIGSLLTMEVYVVSVSDRIVALCEIARGQLEGCGEYQMGRVSDMFSCLEL
jgi:hypothetical protein